ncbi:hypothetical protein L1887_05577 [Cichorium endivia]|nr:hypothetical protein L1887_05577 [Cichorium endivia]
MVTRYITTCGFDLRDQEVKKEKKNPEIDVFMKATAVPGQETSLIRNPAATELPPKSFSKLAESSSETSSFLLECCSYNPPKSFNPRDMFRLHGAALLAM